MNNLEQLKKQYESGDWVCYGQVLHGVWEKQSTFKYGNAYKLIHKKHEDIADAIIANPDVEVEYLNDCDTQGYEGWLYVKDFFSDYERLAKYRYCEFRLENPKQEEKEDGTTTTTTSTNGRDDNHSNASDDSNDASTISITDSDGTEYSFEKPSFECELLKAIEGKLVGYCKDTQTGYINGCTWFTDGSCWMDDRNYSTYNLTPIKPKWYEDESNFPALVWDDQMDYFDLLDTKHQLREHHRLATHEELMSLHYKDK